MSSTDIAVCALVGSVDILCLVHYSTVSTTFVLKPRMVRGRRQRSLIRKSWLVLGNVLSAV